MDKHIYVWHESDIRDELKEYHEARGLISKWSELSDLSYTWTRAKWSGHLIEAPVSLAKLYFGIAYMFPKYTLRWLFFRRAAKRIGPSTRVHEVRNPKKIHKLNDIAKRNGLDVIQFQKACEHLLKYWPLLP